MPYSDQEAFLNAYLKNYAKAQQNAINSGKTGMSSARYTGQQAMNAAPTTLPDYGDIANSFTSAYTKQLAAVEAQREKEAKAAQAAAEKEARAAAKAAAKAAKKAKEKAEDERKKAEESSNSGNQSGGTSNQSGGTGNTNNGGKDDSSKKKGLWSAIKEGAAALVKKGPSAVKDGVVQGTALHNRMKAARGGVSAEDSVDLGGVQTPQATAAKQRSGTKARASVAKQTFTTQELDARLTATNQRMRELQKQGKTKTREYRQLQNQHDTYATALGVDSLAGRAGATGLGAVSGFAAGVANMGDATARAIRGQSESMDIPEYEAASDDLQAANEQRDALIQMGRAYTDTPNGPVATPEFQQVLDRIASAKGVRAENQVTPERNQVVSNMLDFAQNQNQKAQAGLGNTGRFVVGTIGSVAQNLPAFAAAAAVPEAAPVLIPALMGVSAAGNRENELEQRGVPLNQAVLRSGLSGAVSAITNKLPLEQGAELMAGNGPGLVRAMARQALSEGGQEASEYAADYGLDVLAGDPDANFSLSELGQQALGGALGGAISAAGSSLIGNGVNRAREAFGANGNAPVDTDVQQAEPVSPDTETAPQQPTAAAQDAVQSPVTAAVEAFRNGTLTNQQLDDLKPGGALRSEFEAATGMTLPETSSATRNALKAGMQEEIPYLRPVDSAENTGYDGTNEIYTGGASYDGRRGQSGNLTQSDGEGREGIPELLRNVENGSGPRTGSDDLEERGTARGSQVLRGFLTASPEAQNAIKQSGATPLELRDTTSDPQLFSTALEEARQKNPHGLMVSPKTVEELSQPGTRTFMSADNMAGALVTEDGDIEAVFKNPQSKAKQAATSLLITAVENGGRKLDCYGKDLVSTYNKRGFEAVARIPFNAGEVEDGWTYGNQDVYVLKLRDGVTAQDIAGQLGKSEMDGGFHMQTDAELSNLPVFDDYDEALAYRDSLLTTHAESGSIPELMSTANQSVQEPIPTLADHPNTVGAAQRQFDRPEVASQSHMTRDTDNDYLQPLVQRDQGGEQKFTHERVSNADRMKIAANSMETESRDEIVSRLTSKEQWDADDTALAGSVLREWDLALGDMDKSGEAYKQALAQKMKFTQRISESNTMNAQALQMTQEFTTPETAVMQSQKSIKTAVDRVANGKNKRKFDQYKSDVETAIANAEDTATQKANDAVQKAIETVRQQVANETDQPSVEDALGRKLAAAVNRYATDGKEASVEDVVQSEMLSQLTKMATSDTEKGARPKKPKLTVEQKLQTALDNQETYTQAWEAAKEALAERYKDNADMSSRLQAFFNDAGESGLYGKDTIKQLVSKYTKDQGLDFKALVKKGRRDKQSTLREIQERIQDTFDMDDTQAQRIAEMAMNEYSKALSEAADANLKAILGGKGKTSKSTHDQFLELLRMGVYDNEDVKAYAASKFGVQPLTAEQCQQILDLAERAEQLPANSRDRVLLESEAATIAARNLSGSFHDAWDVWRYTSMLFNARTNEKNIGGNVSMGLNARTKDVVLAAMEWMINKVAPGKVERTTAIVTPFTENGRALLAASANDADLNSYRQLSGTSERMNLARDMQRHREAFRSLAPSDSNNIVTKFLSGLDHLAARASAPLEVSDYEGAFGVLEGLRGINKNMDAAIDWIRDSAESATNKGVLGVAGLKNNYAWSLAQYLKANGADASIFDATDAQSLALLDKARAHAIQQALINTYHAESKTATAVSKFKADLRGSDNFASRVLGDIVEGQLPFVKTPINVAKQSLQYSPLGFVSTAAEGIKVARGTGDVNLMLDHAAASVTGSLLFALGGILAEKGLLTAGIGDDEKDKANLEGRQEYSLQLVDDDGKLHSYTIDWANAAAIPMFAGAEYAKLAASDGASLNSVASASQQVLEPLLEMSFLQGLNDNLESLRYSEDPYIYGMAKQSLSSYATQGIPTLVGQVARSIDPVRRSTYSGTTGIESDIGYTANKIRNKIPFLSETGQPYIDAFGDTQPNTGGSFAGRLAYNMFSPGYYSETTDDPVQLGLLDLANSTGNDEVIPELAAKKLSWTVDKEKHTYQLSPQEYTDFATQQGQLRKDMAEAVLDSRYTEEQQVELIPELYGTAGKIAALDIVPDFSVGTEERKRIDIYNQYGIDGLMNWIAYRKYANTDGKTGINQSEARAWLNDSDMSDAMKDAFWAASSSTWKSSR